MASLRAKMIVGLTRWTMRFMARPGDSVETIRRKLAKLDHPGPTPANIRVTDQEGPVAGRWLRNDGAKKVVLYLHGGAFILRLPKNHSSMVARICDACETEAFMPWYRLAPEHPFPAAPEDCLAAYRYLLDEGYRPEQIILMGDSAGGNLVLSLTHLIKKNELPAPFAAVMLSPVIDFAQISAAWRQNTKSDPIYPLQAVVNPAKHYLQGSDPMDPIASPSYGDYSGFPPLFFLVGGIEVLVDDSVAAVKKAVEQGVQATVHIWEGLPHVFPLTHFLPESPIAIEKIANWLSDLEESERKTALYRTCVEVFNRKPMSRKLHHVTNDLYLQP